MKISIIILLLIATTSCGNKYKFKQIVQEWQNKEIIFPHNLTAPVNEEDSILQISNQKYKIFNYIDTNGCTSCRLKLYDWKLLKDELDSLRLNVQFIFIAHTKEIEELETLRKVNKFDVPIYYDYNDSTNLINQFPSFPLFQTFLLNPNNQVIYIGNPIYNEQIWELYKKKIMEENQER